MTYQIDAGETADRLNGRSRMWAEGAEEVAEEYLRTVQKLRISSASAQNYETTELRMNSYCKYNYNIADFFIDVSYKS